MKKILLAVLALIICSSSAQFLNCDSMSHGSVLPHSLCYKFYYCYNGIVSTVICAEYHKFNEESGRCEYSPDCNQGTSPPISSDNPCLEEKDGNTKPHSSSCKFYYYCSQGLAILQMCPDGWGFSESDSMCVSGLNCA